MSATLNDPVQLAASATEWTWFWLGVLGVAFLVSVLAFGFIRIERRAAGPARRADSFLVRRFAAFLRRTFPALWRLLRVPGERFVRPRRSTNDRRWMEPSIAGVVVLVTLSAFFLIAEGWTDQGVLLDVDRAVYGWLMQTEGSRTIGIMRAVTRLGDTLVVTGIAIAMGIVFLIRGRYGRIVVLILAPGAGSALVLGLKQLFGRARPEAQVYAVAGHSFPSGHAFAAMALYGYVIYLVWRDVENDAVRIVLATILSVLILLIGLSRVLLRVHWITDVAGGFMLGLAWLVLSLVAVRAGADRIGSNIGT